MATRLLNQGMHIHSLRKLLGHSNLGTTQIYARIYDETLYEQFKDAMGRLESLVVDERSHAKTSTPLPTELESSDSVWPESRRSIIAEMPSESTPE